MKKEVGISLGVWAIAACILLGSALLFASLETPKLAYFNELAAAFLKGQVYLPHPAATHDLTNFAGRWYVPFLPLPALMMLPWVALFGLKALNTVVFNCVIGGLNASLVFLLVRAMGRRGWSRASLAAALGLSALFTLGSVHWYMSLQGSVWFISQVCTVTFLLASLWLAVEFASPVWAGLALGLAMLGRPTVFLMLPLLLAIGIQHGRRDGVLWQKQVWNWGWRIALPVGICVVAILGYNQIRFQNFLDFGYLTENVDPSLKSGLMKFGQFNLHFLPHNLWAMLLAGPVWDAKQGIISPAGDGMSIFLTTPALFFLFRKFKKDLLSIGAWVAIAFLLVPLLLYYNTGWWQFGYRFSLDFMPAVMLLFALGLEEKPEWGFWFVVGLGVLVNAWGALWF